MKKYLLISILFSCFIPSIFAELSSEEITKTISLINDTDLTLKDTFLTKCPFGHEDIRRIPIIWELRDISPEEQNKIDNLELWYGGCQQTEENHIVVCAKCRYAYNPYSGYWWKATMKPDDLRIKIDNFIDSFLQFCREECKIDIQFSIWFNQYLKNENHYIDRAIFHTKMKKTDLLKSFKKYFNQNSLQPKESICDDSIFYEYKDINKMYKISISKSVKKYYMIEVEVNINKNI